MSTAPDLSLFVRVDCDAYSRHRDPKGVYQVDVIADSSMIHNACVAMSTIKSQVAFIHENLNRLSMRVFTKDGNEVLIPGCMDLDDLDTGHYKGRAQEYPEHITIQ